MEARLQKEESERIKRENAREQRRKEREAREESRKGHDSAGYVVISVFRASNTLTLMAIAMEPRRVKTILNPKMMLQPRPVANHGTPKPTARMDLIVVLEHRPERIGSYLAKYVTVKALIWYVLSLLDIAICYSIHQDDGTPMMSCGRCSKWQHIFCHDRADQAAGRPRRNWDSVDFICKSCRLSQQRSHRHYPISMKQPLPSDVPQMHAYRPYPQPLVNHSSVDLRPSAYSPSYKDPPPQSFYVRPSNSQQLNTQSPYSAGPSSSHVVPPARPAIAFSHYQPAAHGFSPGVHKPYPDAHYSYNYPNQQYNQVVPAPYKPQVCQVVGIYLPIFPSLTFYYYPECIACCLEYYYTSPCSWIWRSPYCKRFHIWNNVL